MQDHARSLPGPTGWYDWLYLLGLDGHALVYVGPNTYESFVARWACFFMSLFVCHDL
jgi:hypothetical protein